MAIVVAVENRALAVVDVYVQPVDFREGVAVDEEQVQPAIVVEVQKAAAPADEAGVLAQAGFDRGVLKFPFTSVAIQSFQLIRKVGTKNRGSPLPKVIACRHPHAGECFAALVQSRTAQQAFF